MIKSYKLAAKPRHIVNGTPFNDASAAMQYIKESGFTLERIERIFKIMIYHVKNSG